MSIYNSLCYTCKVYVVIFVNNIDLNMHWQKKRDIVVCSHVTIERIAHMTSNRLA